MPFGPGETFERYAIEALIGRGGMGEVYRAVDTRLRRKVALKVIRPDKDRPDAAARLYREARAAAALTHPNAVAVHDVGEAEGVFYIVMELVVGQPLLAFVGDPRVTVLKKVAWLTDVARALSAAHRAGIIHRDVKPSNVMVSEDGFPKVLDFGLARPVGPIDPVSFRTQEGRVLGTLRYMAPEQVVGAEADARSDQYAFGLTAYELLAGSHPGGGLIDTKPKRIDEIAKDVPPDIAIVVERTLARDPDKRFASMDEVVHALEASISTMRAPPPYMTPSPMIAAATLAGGQSLASDETAETISAQKIQIAMRPSDQPPAQAPTLAALAGEGARQPTRARPHESTLITKEAPSALQVRPPAPPTVNTLPLAQGMQTPPAPAAGPVPRTLVSGTPPSNPPPPMAHPVVTIPSSPPPRMHPSAPPQASQAPSQQRTITIVASVGVLAIAAFLGTYLGSQHASAPPAPSATPTASTAEKGAAALTPALAKSSTIPGVDVTPLPEPSASVAPPPTSPAAPPPRPRGTGIGVNTR